MKKCPICNEPNEDNRETCSKCHVSLDFKVYKANEEETNMKEYPDIQCGEYICKHCTATTPYKERLCVKCLRNKTITKIVLYFIFIAIYSIIITSLRWFAHIQLGGIPTAILIGITLYLPRKIVNIMFSHRKIEKIKQTKTIESLPKKQAVKKTSQSKSINTESTLRNNTKTTKKIKTDFCKKCGKQYFYPQRVIKSIKQIRFSKKIVTVFIIVTLLICSVGFNIYQYINTILSEKKLNNQISNLNSTIESKDKTIDELKIKYNSQESMIEYKNNTIEELKEEIKSYEKVDSYKGESDTETDTKRTFADEIRDYRAGKISGDKYYSNSPYPSYPYDDYVYTIR